MKYNSIVVIIMLFIVGTSSAFCGNKPADKYYIIITTSPITQEITDVYKLKNIVWVPGISSTYILDSVGKKTKIPGRSKIIELGTDSSQFNNYIEYHQDIEVIPYKQKLAESRK